MVSCFGKSAMSIIETEHLQLSPQHFFFLFSEFEQQFCEQSFWHLGLQYCVSFLWLFFPHAHAEVVVDMVKTSSNITLSDMETINFML